MGLKFGLSRECELSYSCNPTDALCRNAELSHELSLVSAEALLDGETHGSPLCSVNTRARR